MNCDQAFEVMTSSHRDCDRGLRSHLAVCPRCREMRETLDPALHMFSSAVPDSSEYHDDWPPSAEATEIATCAARQLSQTAPAPTQRGISLWGYTAAIVLGASLVWCSIVRTPASATVPSIQRSKTVCRYLSETRPRDVSAMEMTKTCLACHSVAPPAVTLK